MIVRLLEGLDERLGHGGGDGTGTGVGGDVILRVFAILVLVCDQTATDVAVTILDVQGGTSAERN